MRALGLATAIALTLLAGLASGAATADDTTPSRREVHQAEVAARDGARDVATVQADLVLANQRLQQSAVQAAQAAEAWNGARYRLQQARDAVAASEQRATVAAADVRRQQQAYAGAITTSYMNAPELTAFGAIVDSDGIETVIERSTTMANAESALDAHYDEFRAAETLAEVATQQAQDARDRAMALQVEARAKRDQARAAADAAAAEAASIAQEKDALIAELARLQHVSTRLAQRRQSALEAKAAAAAQAAAEAQAEAEAEAEDQADAQSEEQEQQAPEQQAPDPQPAPQPAPSPQSSPQPSPQPDPSPQPTPAPPAPSGGASAAIAFARDQVGEPYRWGAAGPSAWDCSGLTMGAWEAGGTALPHYSVAQYEQATPVSAGSLQAGDLVFWGSSSDPSSIYHVALYIGGGQIIHAPRTGRPVTQESMYYWTPPNFYARP